MAPLPAAHKLLKTNMPTLDLFQPRRITKNERDCLKTVCISIGIFLVLLYCCALQACVSVTTRVEYEPYVCWISFFTSGMLLCSFVMQASAIMYKRSKREIPVRLVTGAVVLIGGVSHLLIALQVFGDIFDVFGCSLPIVRWVEWQILTPYKILLLHTLDVPTEGAHYLPRQASVSVTFQTFRIIFFVLGAISQSPVLTAMGYAIAVGLFMESFVSLWCFYQRLRLISDHGQTCFSIFAAPTPLARSKQGDDDAITQEKEMQIVFRGFQLNAICTFTCLGVCAIYFSGASGLDRNIQRVLTSLLDCGTKLLYSAGVREGHLDYFDSEEILKYMIESQRERELQAIEKRKIFLRYIFHEIRVPLNIIVLGMADLAQTETLCETGQNTIESMKISAGLMSNTLNDALSFSAIEDGRLTLATSAFNLVEAITTTIEAFSTVARAENITIHQFYSDSLPRFVHGDAKRICQVLANLLSNSMKFTRGKPNNKVSVRVQSCITTTANYSYITIAVEDNGIGISNEDQQKLFIPYGQIRPGELQEGRGSGLGLVIAQQLCELHGGWVQVESVLGQGSTFSATFKLGFVSTGLEVLATPKSLDHSQLSLLRVLVVDDVKTSQRLVKRLLERMGVRVIDMAENGEIAVDKATLNHYDVIFMDMMMPVMDGVQATTALTKRKVKTKIVGLTGNALDEDIERFKRAGAVEVLIKPVNATRLEQIFSNAILGRH